MRHPPLAELVSRLAAHAGSPYRVARAALGRRAPVPDVERLAMRIERHARANGGPVPVTVTTGAKGGSRRGLWRWLAGVRLAEDAGAVIAAVVKALPELEAAHPDEVERLRRLVLGGRVLTRAESDLATREESAADPEDREGG